MDWVSFLTKNNIEFITSGPNTGRGHVSIQCPWCDDPSKHLGISIDGLGYNCWRCSNKGRSPVRLIQKLIHCDYETASQIAGIRAAPTIADQSLTAYIDRLFHPKETKMATTLEFPSEIRLLADEGWASPLCMDYMVQKRGYAPKEALECAQRYSLHYAMSGPFAWRIIFPVYDSDGNLLTWTGRAIGNSIVRYRTLSPNPERAKRDNLPQALISLKSCIWNQDVLCNWNQEQPDGFIDTVIITEGPFDAMRIDLFGLGHNIKGTCTFGKQITDDQIIILSETKTRSYWLALDADAELDLTNTLGRLAHLNCQIRRLPKGIKDPAMLTRAQFEEWVK